jgi:FMN-dependent NADH-azoreductase
VTVPNLLHLDSSAESPDHSRSRAITRAFADAWLARGADFTVTYRDLHANPVPHLADASLHWPARLRPEDAAPPAEAEQLQGELITELVRADAIVVGAPLYNYSVPSSLKAWIDHIHVPGVTAPFDVPAQPMAGKPAVIVSARGGSYEAGSRGEGRDHGVPVLEIILGDVLGMNTTLIQTDLTLADTVPAMASDIDRSRQQLDEALLAAATLGATVSVA